MRVIFEPEIGTVEFTCPGCGWTHILNVDPKHGKPRWTFNGDIDMPTLSPSIDATTAFRNGKPRSRCHSFVRDGRIEFLGDSTHVLAGQTVELPEILARVG